MKAFKFIGMLLAAFALSFTATSCGDDDNVDDIIKDFENGKLKPTAQLKKSDTEMVLTIKMPQVSTQVSTAKFRDGLCVSFVIETTYETKALADLAWKNTESDQNAKRDGNKIINDLSKEYEGVQYQYVEHILEMQKRSVEEGANSNNNASGRY